MSPKQKDTIREEFLKMWPELNTHQQLLGIGRCERQVIDWWLNKLDQAYQQGAKDSLNRVKSAKTTLVNPDFPVVMNIIVDTVARGMNLDLKDNT